jgi:uncharacterized protein (DUF302 family)
MSYYFSTTLSLPFETAIERVSQSLAAEGFGVLTDIDVSQIMKQKLGADLPPYRILGACNPALALAALKLENKIGTMLPCNVVVHELVPGSTEVAAVDPVASMQAVGNPSLEAIASTVQAKLRRVIENLQP